MSSLSPSFYSSLRCRASNFAKKAQAILAKEQDVRCNPITSGFPLIRNARNTSPGRYSGCPFLCTHGLIVEILRSLESLGTAVSMSWSVALTAFGSCIRESLTDLSDFTRVTSKRNRKGKKKRPKNRKPKSFRAPCENEALHSETYDGTGCTSKVQTWWAPTRLQFKVNNLNAAMWATILSQALR